MNNVILGKCKLMSKSIQQNRRTWRMKTVILREDQFPETVTVIGIPVNALQQDYPEGTDMSISGQMFHKETNGQVVLYMLISEVAEALELGQNLALLNVKYNGMSVINKSTGRQEVMAEYQTNAGNKANLIVDIDSKVEEKKEFANGQNIFISGALLLRRNQNKALVKILATTLSSDDYLRIKKQSGLSRLEQNGKVLYVKDSVLDADSIQLAD